MCTSSTCCVLHHFFRFEVLSEITLKQKQDLFAFIKKEISDEETALSLPSASQAKVEYTIDELQGLDVPTLVNLFTIKECLPNAEVKYKCQLLPGCVRCYTRKVDNDCKELITAHLLNHVESLICRSKRNPTLYANKLFYPCLQKAVKEEVADHSCCELSAKVRRLSGDRSNEPQNAAISEETSVNTTIPPLQTQFQNVLFSVSRTDKKSSTTENSQAKSERSKQCISSQPKVIVRDLKHSMRHQSNRNAVYISRKPAKPRPLTNLVKSKTQKPSVSDSSDEDDMSTSGSESDSSDSVEENQRSRFSMKQKRCFGSRTLASTLRNRTCFRLPVRRRRKHKQDSQQALAPTAESKRKITSNSIEDRLSCNNVIKALPSGGELPLRHQLSLNEPVPATASQQECSPTSSNAPNLFHHPRRKSDENSISLNSIKKKNVLSSSHIEKFKERSSILNNSPTSLQTVQHNDSQSLKEHDLAAETRSAEKATLSQSDAPSHSERHCNSDAELMAGRTPTESSKRRHVPSILRRKCHKHNELSKPSSVETIVSSELQKDSQMKTPAQEPDPSDSVADETADKQDEKPPSNADRHLDSQNRMEEDFSPWTNTKKSRKQDLVKSLKEDTDEQVVQDPLYTLRHDHCYTNTIWPNAGSNAASGCGFLKLVVPVEESLPVLKKKMIISVSSHENTTNNEYRLKGPSSKQVEPSTDPKIKAKALSLISELRHRKPSEVMVCTERIVKEGKSAFIVQDFYSCEICGKRFTAPNSLYGHYRAHAGIKPYVCKLCGQTFTRSHSLSYHAMIHSNTARFECEICNKKFRHPTHFKEHMHRHTGEEPYVCTDCPRRFKTRNTFRRHMITKHQKKITPMGSLPVNSRIINFISKPGVARTNAGRDKPERK